MIKIDQLTGEEIGEISRVVSKLTCWFENARDSCYEQ